MKGNDLLHYEPSAQACGDEHALRSIPCFSPFLLVHETSISGPGETVRQLGYTCLQAFKNRMPSDVPHATWARPVTTGGRRF